MLSGLFDDLITLVYQKNLCIIPILLQRWLDYEKPLATGTYVSLDNAL